jgi:hypothetical protein
MVVESFRPAGQTVGHIGVYPLRFEPQALRVYTRLQGRWERA